MLRTLVRSALIAALITGGSLLAPQVAEAAPNPCVPGDTRKQCKNPESTGCNQNNPKGKGCPAKGGPGSPVCGKGKHKGNPHCTAPGVLSGGTVKPDLKPNVKSSGTRVVSARTTPRANRAVAPRSTKAVATRAAKAL